ncbi:MAG: hypothetical protein JWM89_3898 [Acidimicrobiales bacterium]|nr:hypothetical protein [Acidimicrobiales bacterium]
MADVNIDTITDTLRDAIYVGIGAGVIGFQKLQVQRQELTKAVTAQLDEARGTAKGSLDSVSELVEDRVKQIEERLEGLEGRLEALLAQIEDKLPEQARDLVKQARDLVARAA